MKTISLALCVALVGGCAQGTTYEPQYWKAPDHEPGDGIEKNCSGTWKGNGCDDCNPCTWDQWCDPATHEGFEHLLCAQRAYAGCVHSHDYTTPEGQINDCFPVNDYNGIRAGKCCYGRCVDNGVLCGDYAS